MSNAFGEVFDASEGPCAKRAVKCTILSRCGRHFSGENTCANPQSQCPRKAGEGYAKCRTICEQGDHAEVKALRLAGSRALGSTAIITGHHYICEPCGKALQKAGVSQVIINLSKGE